MAWYDSLATYAIGGPLSIGGAYGTFKGLEYLINQLPPEVIHQEWSFIERLFARGAESAVALGVGTALIYATNKAHQGEWFSRARSKCGEAIQNYRKRIAEKAEYAEMMKKAYPEEERGIE